MVAPLSQRFAKMRDTGTWSVFHGGGGLGDQLHARDPYFFEMMRDDFRDGMTESALLDVSIYPGAFWPGENLFSARLTVRKRTKVQVWRVVNVSRFPAGVQLDVEQTF